MLATTLVLASIASLASAINPIQVNGTKFFDSVTGSQFFIKGVAYQPSDINQTTSNTASGALINDPLADPAGCAAAAPLIQALGANVIRTYRVNATLNHDACMKIFADAGIYLFLDLETPYTTVISDAPTWTVSQYAEFAANVDAFAGYANTAGFFIGNENIDKYNVSSAAPFVKAAARDMRSYIKAKGYRAIPVGYAGADVADLQIQLAEYLACGAASDGIDFYGINIYRWCGQSSYTESGYDVLEAQYKNLSRPVFFSEFGCNIPLGQTRTFGEIPSLYGIMSDTFSGGIAYEWIQESNLYGLVTSASAGGSPTPLPDYSVLKTQWAAVTPSSVALSAYVGTTKSVSCPALTSGFVAATSLPPTPDAKYCSCAVGGAKCSAVAESNGTAIGAAFGIVCGLNNGAACNIIQANGTSPGTYGQYGFCSGQQQLALVYQNYYSQQSSQASACGFSLATLLASAAATSCAHNSGAAIATGNVLAGSSNSASSGSGSGSGSSGSSSSSGSKSAGIRSADQYLLNVVLTSGVLGCLAFIIL